LVVNDDALGRDTSDKAPAESRPSGVGLRARVPAAIRQRLTAEHAVVLALGLLVLVVHDVGYMLSQSFWTDEAWVAVTTRFPLSQLLATTNSTPIGWSVLLRGVTEPATQTSRLLPLAFAGGAVIIAYWFARRLGWRWTPASVAAGLTAAIGVLLVPAMLHRNDLKQYTADACLSLLVLALTSRLERAWSRRGLAALSVAVCGGMLFSDAAAFVGIAAFGAVCAVELARRRWRRLAEAVVIGLGTAVVVLGLYLAFDSRAVGAEVTGASASARTTSRSTRTCSRTSASWSRMSRRWEPISAWGPPGWRSRWSWPGSSPCSGSAGRPPPSPSPCCGRRCSRCRR
jgi:hypothetical protein